MPKSRMHQMLELYTLLIPDKPYVITPDRTLLWKELLQRGQCLAKHLYRIGLRSGDRVAMMSYNAAEYFEVGTALGLLATGRVMVGYRMKAPEIEYIVNDSDSTVFIFCDEFADRILPYRDRYKKLLSDGLISFGGATLEGVPRLEDMFQDIPEIDLEEIPEPAELPGAMIYTSGTTGKPKGAVRKPPVPPPDREIKLPSLDTSEEPPSEAIAHVQILARTIGISSQEIHLVCCPLYHSAPMLFASLSTMLGGTLVLQPKFDAEGFLELIQKHKVTSSHVVPTQISSLMQLTDEVIDKYDTSSLRALICGAAPLFPQMKLACMDRFGPILFEYYGSTETGINTLITPQEIRERPASVGKSIGDNDLKLLDPHGNEVMVGERGQLYIYNSFLMDGYYKNEAETEKTRHGEYMTAGDIAIKDEDGYIYIVDRVKDMIIRGGANIYPAEVEKILNDMPGVLDSAVVGKPDPHWGETVAAFVVVDKKAQIEAEKIKEYCAKHMANHKIPVDIRFTEEIPRTATGKILKRDLREILSKDKGKG